MFLNKTCKISWVSEVNVFLILLIFIMILLREKQININKCDRELGTK